MPDNLAKSIHGDLLAAADARGFRPMYARLATKYGVTSGRISSAVNSLIAAGLIRREGANSNTAIVLADGRRLLPEPNTAVVEVPSAALPSKLEAFERGIRAAGGFQDDPRACRPVRRMKGAPPSVRFSECGISEVYGR